MQFEGDKDLPLPPETLFGKLADAGFLVGTLTAAQAVKVHGPDAAEWKLKPSLSFVAGTMDAKLQILERTPPAAIRLAITNKGIGSSSTTEVRLALAPSGTGTKLHWTGEITALTGLLKAVPKGLIQSTATKIIEDIWAGVEKKLIADGNP
jgi:carbon monoxide dehydrogenase subunit G